LGTRFAYVAIDPHQQMHGFGCEYLVIRRNGRLSIDQS
jgi:hypothetical protein